MKKLLRIIIFFTVLCALAYFGYHYVIENVLPYSAIRPTRINASNSKLLTPDNFNMQYSNFDITVEDTIKLKGWFVYSKSVPVKGTIFLIHGIGNNKNSMLMMAHRLTECGFNCVLFDLRAHGESGGINCTFGYYEKKDISSYIDSAKVRFPNSAPYGIFGHSLGAAVAIQTLAADKRLSCGVAASPFSDLHTVIRDYFGRMFIFKINAIPDSALYYAGKIAKFPVDSIKPSIYAKSIKQPMLIIHGTDDERISFSYGKEVYDNLASKEKFWYPIPGGKHNNLPDVAGEEYYKKIIDFFKKYLNGNSLSSQPGVESKSKKNNKIDKLPVKVKISL